MVMATALSLLSRQPCRLRGPASAAAACFSSSPSVSSSCADLVLSSVNEDAGVAIMIMNRPPANSLSLEMNEAICASIKSIETNSNIQSVILASTNPTIFSAGLDVSELVSPDEERLPRFWNSLQQVYIDLYGSRLATVAAIQGHAPAAGCFLAMACDYRLMSAGSVFGEKKKRHVPTIGLNETRLGIAAPPWMGQLMVRTIGFRQAELALAMGTLFPPDEALGVGLVDGVVKADSMHSHGDSVEQGLKALLPSAIEGQASDPLMQQAYNQANTFAKIPPRARVASKLVTREDHIADIIDKRTADNDHFCSFVTQDAVQSNLTAYVEALKTKGKKK